MSAASAVLVLVCLLRLPWAESRDFTFTYQLGAGKKECFYDYIHEGALLEIEYQVIEGGDLDVHFFVNGPGGELYKEFHQMDGLHSFDVKQTGEYEICYDNSFSRFSHKSVFMDIIIDDDPGEEEKDGTMLHQLQPDAIFMDVQVKSLRDLLTNVTTHLNKVVLFQQFFRVREARHRYGLEGKSNRVFWWSLANCIVVVTVGIIQVYLVRNLFKSRRVDKIRT